MSDFDNTNRGALFKNNDKTDEQQPDYRGISTLAALSSGSRLGSRPVNRG
jgi:hypothetical protein